MPVDSRSVAVLYHYFPPDDVVSAVHFGELSAGLVQHGWQVTAYPCVWGCRDESQRFPPSDLWRGVRIQRQWRPRFRQSGSGRILNAIWMIARWSWLALRLSPRPDVLIVGTDPVFSVLTARFWNRLSPRTRIVHWCFDLYPEAAIAEGILSPRGLPTRLFKRILRPAYGACTVISDIGPCMRQLLLKYPSRARRETLLPWALDEPDSPLQPDPEERKRIFGDARLALLYSGSFGRAHSPDEILDLAARLQDHDIRIAFSARGNRVPELRSLVEQRGLRVPFVPFADSDQLTARLACPDIHIVSLREEWTGTVVPSKFFGALAAGRPVLFAGSSRSSIAQWIRDFGVGWVLSRENIDEVARQLIDYAGQLPAQTDMRQRCFETYREHFSREVQIERWNELLLSLR